MGSRIVAFKVSQNDWLRLSAVAVQEGRSLPSIAKEAMFDACGIAEKIRTKKTNKTDFNSEFRMVAFRVKDKEWQKLNDAAYMFGSSVHEMAKHELFVALGIVSSEESVIRYLPNGW